MNNSNDLKYCPECIIEDKYRFGEAYIHRKHQIDGYLICNKHKIYLHTLPKVINNSKLIDINELNLLKGSTKIENNHLLQELQSICDDIDNLLCLYSDLPSYEITKEKYYSMLHERAYYKGGEQLNQTKLHEDFTNYYSDELLKMLSSTVEKNNKYNWLSMATRTKLRTVHPIKNILLIRFLFGNISSFIDYSIKPGIHKINLTPSRKSILYFKNNREETYKKRILELINKEPNLSRSEILKRLSHEYLLLSKHNRDWLDSILPKPRLHKDFCTSRRIDWNKEDIHYYSLVNDVINNILDNNITERIRLGLISRKICSPSLQKNIEKLPMTKALVDTHSETIHTFYKRKIRIVLYEMISNDIKITKSILKRKANLPYRYYYIFDDYINNLFEDLG